MSRHRRQKGNERAGPPSIDQGDRPEVADREGRTRAPDYEPVGDDDWVVRRGRARTIRVHSGAKVVTLNFRYLDPVAWLMLGTSIDAAMGREIAIRPLDVQKFCDLVLRDARDALEVVPALAKMLAGEIEVGACEVVAERAWFTEVRAALSAMQRERLLEIVSTKRSSTEAHFLVHSDMPAKLLLMSVRSRANMGKGPSLKIKEQ